MEVASEAATQSTGASFPSKGPKREANPPNPTS